MKTDELTDLFKYLPQVSDGFDQVEFSMTGWQEQPET